MVTIQPTGGRNMFASYQISYFPVCFATKRGAKHIGLLMGCFLIHGFKTCRLRKLSLTYVSCHGTICVSKAMTRSKPKGSMYIFI